MTTLFVGPAGDLPSLPLHEIAGGADVHNPATDDYVLPYPRAYSPQTKHDAKMLPFLLDRLRAFRAWKRDVRPILRRYETIVVWDPLVAVLIRLARPRGVRVEWRHTPPVIDVAWNAVLARLARMLCDPR